MNNTTLLKELYMIKEDSSKLDKLIETIKKEIMVENCASPSEKKRLKSILSYLKNERIALQHSYLETFNGVEYQIITDSFSIFFFEEHLDLPKLPEELSYPNVKPFIKYFELEGHEVNLDYNKICNSIKAHKQYFKSIRKDSVIPVYVEINNNNYCFFDSNRLKSIYDIMGTKELSFKIAFIKNTYTAYSVLLFENNKNQDKGFLLPMRSFEHNMKNVEKVNY